MRSILGGMAIASPTFPRGAGRDRVSTRLALTWTAFAAACAAFVAGAGCSNSNTTPEGGGTTRVVTTPTPTTKLTYYEHTKPILDRRCATCHKQGDIGPFPLTTYEEVSRVASILPQSIQSGSMPPWMPSAECNQYAGDRRLSDFEKEALLAWLGAGAPPGNPSVAAVSTPAEEFKADMVVQMPEPYLPTVSPDEYRCFVLPWEQTDDAFITGYDVRAGNRAMVHHVTIAAVAAADVPELTKLEQADAAPGYECFGGFGVRGNSFGGWSPGARSTSYPTDTGVRVTPGSRIVMQMHYAINAVSGKGDQSSIGFRLAKKVSRPLGIIAVTNAGWTRNNPRMLIPAGEPSVEHSASVNFDSVGPRTSTTLEIPAGSPMLVHEVGLHMHTLGKQARIHVIHEDGQTECALAINAWDFDWQGRYRLAKPLEIGPGDRFEIKCKWDNSAANQPFSNGAVRKPIDVSWGEGTLDEMCMGSFVVGGK
jgi:Copper type II ascorbate-dependent monooxygenase, C-terminal domain